MPRGGSPHPVRDMGNSASFPLRYDTSNEADSFGYHHSMDYANSAIFGSHNILDPNYDWNNPEGTPSEFSIGHDSYHIEAPDYAFNLHDDLEGTPSESFVHADFRTALYEPAAFTDEENPEGTPSEFSIGHDSYAPAEQSTDADLLYATADNLEGTPSEFSTGHISNAPAAPSLDINLLSDADNDSEGTPSESSFGHDINSSTEPPSDEDYDAASTCSSAASAPLPDRFTTPRSTAKFRMRYNHHGITAHSSSAAHAAVLTRQNHPSGTPTGSVNPSLKLGNEHEGTHSCSEPRPPASLTSRTSEAAPTQDFELQLKRLLCLLAKAKQDALIHVAAAETSSQLEQLMPLALANEIAWMDAGEWREQAEAIEDAWLTHLAALAEHDVAAYTTARHHYDRFCEDHGLYANLERAKELVAMLGDVVRQTDEQSRNLRALPPRQKNEAFSIVGKLPHAKLYELPGTPGNPKLPRGQSDKETDGIPCTPQSRPKSTPDSGVAERQHPAAPKSSRHGKAAGPALRRPHCVFCSCHEHWSSDCPTYDFNARWRFTHKHQICQQCLRADHRAADCINSNRRCLHCAARHHAALCPKPHQRFLPSSDIPPNPVPGHPSVATAAGGCSPPGLSTTAHDDRQTTTNPLDTKPPSSFSTTPPAAVGVEAPEHRLARAITSFFQRNSTGTDVVVGFYTRTQDDAGRTFYRILKPLPSSVQLPSAATDLYDHLQVDRVIMLETIAHVLPCDPLLPSTATPDADTRQTRRFTYPSAGSSYCVHPTTQGVSATDLSGVAPRQATVMSDLATAMRTSPLPRSDALSPTTTDSAPGEVEPEDQGTASRRSRRKRGPRRKQNDHSCSTSSTQSTPIKPTWSPAALIVNAGPRDPTHKPLAGSETSGTPLDPLECDDDKSVQSTTPTTPTPTISERQLSLKGRRSWTASSRKAPLPEPSSTTAIMPHDTEAPQARARLEKTVLSERNASGNCQKQLFGCAKAHASSPRSEATKPVTVLFDSAVNQTSCSTLLALDLQLHISSSDTATSGRRSMLPFLTTKISVTLDGGPDVIIPVTLATMSVRTVHTAFVNKRDSFQLPSGSRHASPTQILPHIVIGRDSQHLFRETLSDWTAIELSPDSTNANTTPSEVQPPSDLNGTPLKPVPGRTKTSSTPSKVHPSSSLSGTPLEPDAGSTTAIRSRTHDADATSAPAQRSCAPGGPSTFQEKSMDKQRKPVEDLKEPWVPHDDVPPAAFSLQESDDYTLHRTSPMEHELLHQRRDSAASTLLDVTVVNTELRVNLADSQPVIAMQSSTDAGPHILPLQPVLSILSSIAQDAGTSAASASSGQSSAAATAASAPAATPATPGLAVHAAAAAPVLKLDRERWGMHDQTLSSGDFAIHRWGDSFFVRRQPVWVTPLEARKLMMSELRQIVVSELWILLHGQILHVNTWTQHFPIRSPCVWPQHNACRHNIMRILHSQDDSFACVYIFWFPTDEQLPESFEAVRRKDLKLNWTISLPKPDGTPSGGVVIPFWKLPDDGSPGRSDDHGREQTRLNAAAILQVIQGPKVQQHRPHALPDHGRTSNAVNANPATEHEPMNRVAADAEGTPSADAIPLPTHMPSRTRSPTAKLSGDDGLEKDGSPATFSDFSDSPAPGTSVEPDIQLQINQQTMALFPHAGPELLGKLRDDCQKLALALPDAEAMGKTTSVPSSMPIDAHPAAAADEDTKLSDSSLTPMDANAPRAARNSSQPIDEPAPLNPDSGHLPMAIAVGSLSPTGQPVVIAYVSHNPSSGHPSVASAAGGRSPSSRFADLPRNPGLGHPSVATAAGGRSPPDTDTSDNIRTMTLSTERRRGTLRASSRGLSETRRFDQPRLDEGRRGH